MAAKELRLTWRQLATELVAYAPLKRRTYDYWRGSIDYLIADKAWSRLADRLGGDKWFVDFAFPHTPVTAKILREGMERLEKKYFVSITVEDRTVISYEDKEDDSDSDTDGMSSSESDSESDGENGSKGGSKGDSKSDGKGKGMLSGGDVSSDDLKNPPFSLSSL